ncbi:HamA C-terminal domain-containing protein [Variovorax sp. W2I14]|uniref:HamA C-terminal domain-containing protein n=1 Tax=Variovorax sp. W2I14 TaxID=3042290 RepID=UPI003D1E769A
MSSTSFDEKSLAAALAALQRDFSTLSPRIRQVSHQVSCQCESVNLHLHFPAIRQGKATIDDLVQVLSDHLIPFCTPRSEVDSLKKQYGVVDAMEFGRLHQKLIESAKSLFKKANRATNRNGEAGELLLYLMTEWILDAPQLVAKMSLKTNSEMPIHGSDGIHVKYCASTSRLLFYWGESKIYKNINEAIKAAAKSIKEALQPEKLEHELQLVQTNISLSGIPKDARDTLLEYLNPYSENSNSKHDISTCLIGFDYEGFGDAKIKSGKASEADFRSMAVEKLKEISPLISQALIDAELENHPMEIFLFPVPSVQKLRDIFQAKIGWND